MAQQQIVSGQIVGGGGGGGTAGTFDITVSNNTGSLIADRAVVNWTDNVTASQPRVQLTGANGVDTAGEGFPLGITIGSIANGATGTVRCFGIVDSLDTHLFSVGDDLQGTSGALAAASLNPWLGLVLVSDASAGKVFVGNSLLSWNIPTHGHNNALDGRTLSFPVWQEETGPATPAAGFQVVFIDSNDHVLKRKTSDGTVHVIG